MISYHCGAHQKCSRSLNRVHIDDLKRTGRMKKNLNCRLKGCVKDANRILQPLGTLFAICSLRSFVMRLEVEL